MYRCHLIVKSSLPGRVRVKLEGAGAELGRLLERLREIGGSVERNALTRTLLIRYDPERLSPEVVNRVLAEYARDSRVLSAVRNRIRMRYPDIGRHVSVSDRLKTVLMRLPGVSDFSVSHSTCTVLVEYDEEFLACTELLEVLDRTVHDAPIETARGAVVLSPLFDRTSLRLLISSTILALSALVPFAPSLLMLGLVVTFCAATPILSGAIQALLVDREIKVDILDATVIALALAYRRLFPAAFMVWVVDLTNLLLASSSRRSRKRIAEIFGRQTRKAWLLIDGTEIEVSTEDLQAGQHVVVRSGEQIPVDGTIVEGEALIDTSTVTGEYAPAERIAGEAVFAMSVVLTGRITLRITRAGEETNAARMVALIEQSLKHKMRMQTFGERFADWMVIPTVGLGLFAYWSGGRGPLMAVINADYGTGIRISAPLALLASVSAAAKNGILVKKGSALESLNDVDAVIFDKTGTLTNEVPSVTRVIVLAPEFSEKEILQLAANAEQRLSHPVAKAVLAKAAEMGIQPESGFETEYHIGLGIQVRIGATWIHVGSQRYLDSAGIVIPENAIGKLEQVYAGGGSVLFVAVANRVTGLLCLEASRRPEATELIRALREKRGIEEIYLISGDHEAPTRELARQLGIERYVAEVLPEAKGEHVDRLRARGFKVAMIGDGVNDTVGLARADVSVSIHGAADAATDVADIVLMDGNLLKFDLLMDISANLAANMRQSLALALVPNSVLILGALAGWFGLSASLVLNNVFNVISTANGFGAQGDLRQLRMGVENDSCKILADKQVGQNSAVERIVTRSLCRG